MDGVTRVVVVDDHELMAASLTAPLAAYDDVAVQSIGFATAFTWTREWTDVDVALLDAADPGTGDDHYPGVRLARHVRRHGGPNIVIAVVTGRYTDDALRARLARLGRDGADYCFDRDDLREAAQLHDFVVDPSSQRAPIPEPDPAWLEEHGITLRTDLEAVIEEAVGDPVLGPESHLARSAVSRRAVDRRLSTLNALGLGRPGRRDRNATVEQARRLLRKLLGR